MDEANRQWLDNVQPADWQNPRAAGRYNLVVIGGGTAGLVAAAGAAGLGARVALVENRQLGGDCLNAGCVPSKALLAVARQQQHARDMQQQAWAEVQVGLPDFGQVMQRMRQLRARISQHDSAQRFRDLGVDVYLGKGCFTGTDQLEVDGQTLKFRKAVLATGGTPRKLDLEWPEGLAVYTNETLFQCQQRPDRLLVVGGGPIGCEMAQAFASFGTEVALIDRGQRLLNREDPEAAALIQKRFQTMGIAVHCGAELQGVQKTTEGYQARILVGRDTKEISIDAVLMAMGRQPAWQGMGLESAGVHTDQGKLVVDDYYRTTNRRVYAAGDVIGGWQFTHAADFMSRAILQNALFFGRKKLSDLVVPKCVYTMPEVASVGWTAQQAQEAGSSVTTVRLDFSTVDRAVLDGQTEGWAEVRLQAGSDRIRGATIVGEDAGDLISQISLAMTQRIGLGRFAATMYPYPTRAEVIRKLGDQYNRTRLTPLVSRLFDYWMRWQR